MKRTMVLLCIILIALSVTACTDDSNVLSNEVTTVIQPNSVAMTQEATATVYKNGIIYLTEELNYNETYTKATIFYDGGEYSLSLPKKASVESQSETHLSFSLENEFTKVKYTLEVVSGITSAPEAELKIKSITDLLPYSLPEGYSGVYVIQDLKDHSYYADKMNFDDIWYDDVDTNGAAYFYESSSHTNYMDIVYDTMKAECYSYFNGVAIHEQMEIVEFNFVDYYAGLETRIEQNAAKGRMMECIVIPFNGTAFEQVQYGFSNCIWEQVKVNAN